MSAVRLCPDGEVDAVERELCASAGIAPQSLAACPYVFVGPPERMIDALAERIERLRLRHLILVPAEHDVLVRFRRDVVGVVSN